MTHKQKLHQIWEICANALSEFGPVFIAGGAPRNALLDIEAKDYDVFIFNKTPFAQIKDQIHAKLEPFKYNEEAKLLHRSEPYLVRTLSILGEANVQVMVVPYDNVDQLLDSFDWNVCLFCYGGQEIVAKTDISEIAEGKELKLNRITFPRSTLRRGYRFSERFKMKLPCKTVDKIIQKIVESKEDKEKDYEI
jgi:hypothetical protein